LNKDSFINFMHRAAAWERPVPYTNQSTAQLIENYLIRIYNLQTQHILMPQSYSWVVKQQYPVL